MVRLQNERLSAYTFNLDGIKEAFGVMEEAFMDFTSEGDVPPLTLEFSSSDLMTEYRSNNDHLTADNRAQGAIDIPKVLSVLLNNPPPNTDRLIEEGSGIGQVQVFLSQTRAEFQSAKRCPGTENTMDGLEANILRVASDYF